MLVRQKENALAARESPLKGGAAIGRSAYQPAALAAKRLDGGCGVHVGQRDHVRRQSEPLERFPASFHLRDLRHVGHRAAGVQVRQDDLLFIAAEHIGALRHEVNAAEHDVLGVVSAAIFESL